MAIITNAPSLGAVVQRLRDELDQIESVFYAVTGQSTVDQYQLHYAPAKMAALYRCGMPGTDSCESYCWRAHRGRSRALAALPTRQG